MPGAAPPPLADPPAVDGTTAIPVDSATFVAAPGPSPCQAWDDQDIDTAGTEADLWFPRGDGGS